MDNIKYEEIINIITKKNRVSRLIFMLIGCFLISITYNAFEAPNQLVTGGMSGLAIIINKFTGLNNTIFIDIATILLAILSLVLVGYKKTIHTIVGFFGFSFMLSFTTIIMPYIYNYVHVDFDSFLISTCFYAFIRGIGIGLIYKGAFNTGGMDSVILIIQKYIKMPTSYISFVSNGLLIVSGAVIFGIAKSIYAIIFLLIYELIANKIVLGTSNNKLFLIKSNKYKDIKEMLLHDYNLGCTLIESTNGIGFLKKNVIMCIVPDYIAMDIKNNILQIDKKTEIIVNDCYTVVGGRTNHVLKF